MSLHKGLSSHLGEGTQALPTENAVGSLAGRQKKVEAHIEKYTRSRSIWPLLSFISAEQIVFIRRGEAEKLLLSSYKQQNESRQMVVASLCGCQQSSPAVFVLLQKPQQAELGCISRLLK